MKRLLFAAALACHIAPASAQTKVKTTIIKFETAAREPGSFVPGPPGSFALQPAPAPAVSHTVPLPRPRPAHLRAAVHQAALTPASAALPHLLTAPEQPAWRRLTLMERVYRIAGRLTSKCRTYLETRSTLVEKIDAAAKIMIYSEADALQEAHARCAGGLIATTTRRLHRED